MNALKPTRCHKVVQSQLSFSRQIHQSAVARESYKQRATRETKAKNIQKREASKLKSVSDRPHPVLGLQVGQPGEEQWKTTKLYQVLIKPEDLRSVPSTSTSQPPATTGKGVSNEVAPTTPPAFRHFGVDEETAKQLLNDLPNLTVKHQAVIKQAREEDFKDVVESGRPVSSFEKHLAPAVRAPTRGIYDYTLPVSADRKAVVDATAAKDALAKIIDLRNASARGVAFANRQRCIEAFSAADGVERKGPDTGRPEVQAALLTTKIRALWDHLTRNPRDIHNRRSLRGLVHQRAKVLKYLKRLDAARYATVLPQLGLLPEAVEGEVIVR